MTTGLRRRRGWPRPPWWSMRAVALPAVLGAMLAAAVASAPGSGLAQPGSLDRLGAGDAPIEIESDQGLELYQEERLVVATGNVVVRQGELVLRADLVSANYAEDAEGRRRIRRLDAVGNMRVDADAQRIFGEHATYDLDRDLVLISGDGLRIEAPDQTITARETLEYWGTERRAVARGDAEAVDRVRGVTLRADVIEAILSASATAAPASQGGADASADTAAIETLRAWGGVTIATATEIVRGDRGEYDTMGERAILTGNVRISRGQNQLNGARAVIDLKSGVSRLESGEGQRVRSIFYPGAEGDAAPARQQPRGGPPIVIPRPRPDGTR